MRRFLSGLALFCLLCGGGLMLVGNRGGAEHEIRMTTSDGTTLEVSLFGRGGTFLNWDGYGPAKMESPEAPEAPEPPEQTGEFAAERADSLEGETITALDLESSTGEITVQPGTEWKVELSAFGSYELEGGTLYVSADTGSMTVTVPEGTALDQVRVNSELGSVTLEDIRTVELTIEQSCGETVLRRCTWTTAEIQNDAGSVNGTGLTSEGLRVAVSAGEVNLQGKLTGDTDIDNDLGSVILNLEDRKSTYGGQLETDLGQVTVGRRSSGKQLDLDGGPNWLDVYCDLGSIEVTFGSN